MEGMRAGLRLAPLAYRIEARLAELGFGDWEGLTLAEVAQRDAERLAARERDKWAFVPPGGESYRQLCVRVSEWYETLDRDSVVAAHGGTMRALLVHLDNHIAGSRTPPEHPARRGLPAGAGQDANAFGPHGAIRGSAQRGLTRAAP
jgi:broad specificity phosphatase PhoE